MLNGVYMVSRGRLEEPIIRQHSAMGYSNREAAGNYDGKGWADALDYQAF